MDTSRDIDGLQRLGRAVMKLDLQKNVQFSNQKEQAITDLPLLLHRIKNQYLWLLVYSEEEDVRARLMYTKVQEREGKIKEAYSISFTDRNVRKGVSSPSIAFKRMFTPRRNATKLLAGPSKYKDNRSSLGPVQQWETGYVRLLQLLRLFNFPTEKDHHE